MAPPSKNPLGRRIPLFFRSREIGAVLGAVGLHAALGWVALERAETSVSGAEEMVPVVLLSEELSEEEAPSHVEPAEREEPPVAQTVAEKSPVRAHAPTAYEGSALSLSALSLHPEVPVDHESFGIDSSEGALAEALLASALSVEGTSLAAGTLRGRDGGDTARAGGDPPPRLEPKRAQLLASRSCDDLYPWNAPGEAQSVTVRLLVPASGSTQMEEVIRATSPHRSLVEAARACSQRLRFAPAQNEKGRTIASKATVRLYFQRGSS